MNEESYPEDTHSPANEPGSQPYAGAFFPRSRNFVVEGGVFTSRVTNITHNHHTSPASHDFRKIPMGEIDLQHEIQFDEDSGVVFLRRGQRRARRMYSARIETCKTAKTVAWYQGSNAEQEWNEDISMHSWLRHPNIIQLYGVADTGSMYAAVFHDDLIPFGQILDLHRSSPILSNYFRAYWSYEFEQVNDYLFAMFQRSVDESGCTLWIRGSNHRLCVDDMMLNDDMSWSYSYMSSVGCWRPGREEAEIMSYTGPNLEAVAISSLTLGPYHKILGHYPPHSHTCYLTTHTTVTLGMVLKHDCEQHKVESSGGSSVHIAFVPLRGMRDMSPQWDKYYSGSGLGKLAGVLALWRTRRKCYLMPSSWRRYNLLDMFTSGASGSMQCNIRCQFSCNCSELWLGSLQIESHHYQYAVVNSVIFEWVLTPTTRASFPSQGWLFICPDTQLRSGPCSFQWPDCAAYWSRDPFGAQRLSTEEAEEAGFPLIELELIALGKSWGAGAYAGLWKFHEGKGFAPDSQEIARHLGHPLYQLCDELGGEAPLAHVTGEEPEANQHPPETLSATSRGEAQTVHFDLGGENKTSRSIHAVSTGFNYAFKLPTSILVLVVLCCLFHTAE